MKIFKIFIFFREFYLIPQPVDRGTVTPTHFNILDKNIDLALDKIQIFTYKLTHLYYNWPVINILFKKFHLKKKILRVKLGHQAYVNMPLN